jgi:hypothetical protein
MAEITIFKTSEKVIVWLHREDKTQVWLAEQMGHIRQSISNKLKDNCFTPEDIVKLKNLGCTL